MRIVLALALILSACSLIYELLVAQSLSLLAGNTVVWYSLTVGAYLAAMGIGAVLYGRREPQQHWAALYRVEMILSLTGALAVLVVHGAHLLYLYLFEIDAATAGAVLFFGLSFAIILFLGLLSGIELPLLIQLGNRVAGGRVVTNRVLGWDYIGALVAGVAFPVLLIPYLELLTIGLLTAGVNLMVALVVLRALLAKERRRVVSTGLSAALGAFLLLGFVYRGDIQQYYLKRYYYTRGLESFSSFFGPMSEMPAVFRASSPYQKIDLVHHPTIDIASFLAEAYSTKFTEDPDKPRNRFLFLNGDFQVASNYEELYHEWFAHVPIMLNGRVPERVLVMGAGDGLLHRELLKHDNLRRIIHVDIDRTLVELARTNPILTAMNELALDDPRVETRFGDAFEFIRRSRDTFDAIYLDFPKAKDYNVSKLYSREFYHFLRERLADNGFVVLDAPELEYGGEDWDIYHHTIRMAGFATVQPYYINLDVNNPRAYALLERSDLVARLADGGGGGKSSAYARPGWKRAFVRAHVKRLKQGFVFMRKEAGQFTKEYRDFGIQLHALNAERFQRAIAVPLPAPAIDPAKVNSILRPTLPTEPFWSIRDAW